MLKKKMIVNEVLWQISLLAYAGIIFYIIVTGKIKILLHPRQYILMISAFAFLLLSAYLQFYHLYSGRQENRKNKSIIIFYLPLLFAVIGIIKNNDSLINLVYKQDSFVPPVKSLSASEGSEEGVLKNSPVIITKDNYYQIYNSIYDNIDKYTGRNIQVSGYIYRENGYENDQFVLAQDLMWCCAADIAVIGFFCEYNNASEFETGFWYELSGRIEKSLYPDHDTGRKRELPSICIDKYRKINPPDIPCIFPY